MTLLIPSQITWNNLDYITIRNQNFLMSKGTDFR